MLTWIAASGGVKSKSVMLIRCPGNASIYHGDSEVPQPVSAEVRLAK
jgi:hypothetical protein